MSETSLVQAVRNFIDQVEAAQEGATNRGGQHVHYHGDFASATPSTRRELDWWRRYFLGQLDRPATFDPSTALECARLVCQECAKDRPATCTEDGGFVHWIGIVQHPYCCPASPIHARLEKEGK